MAEPNFDRVWTYFAKQGETELERRDFGDDRDALEYFLPTHPGAEVWRINDDGTPRRIHPPAVES